VIIAEILLIAIVIAGSVYTALSIYLVLDFFRPKHQEINDAGPISILKPLKGIDPGFEENLRSFCTQDYPEYETLLGFADSSDGAIPEVSRIAQSMPGNVRVVVTSKDLGINKKVSNLQGIFEAARHERLVISDSDMRVTEDYLKTISSEFLGEDGVGMVTCLYKISNPESFGTALESLNIALDFIPSVLVARRLEGVTFGLGASMMVNKKGIEEIGGFVSIAEYIADDYLIGNKLSQKGYKVILSSYVIEDVVGNMSFREYLAHQLRWARTNSASRPGGFFGYGITHIVPLAIPLLFLRGADALSMSIFGGAVFLRYLLAIAIYKKVIRSEEWLRWLVILPVKDCLSFLIWALSFVGSTVVWRGQRYKVLKGGKLEARN
jgi:ceramide glucosyltransferase